MKMSFAERWRRGFVIYILAVIIFGIPGVVGRWLVDNQAIPEWLRTVLLVLWVLGMLLFCPVAFEWLARVTGFIGPGSSDVITPPGPQVNAGSELAAEGRGKGTS